MADNIAAFHFIPFFRALMGGMANEHNTVTSFRIQDDMRLYFTPRLKLGAIQWVQMRWFGEMSVFDETETSGLFYEQRGQ